MFRSPCRTRLCSAVLTFGLIPGLSFAGNDPAAEPKAGSPAPLTGFEDSGTFHVYKNETRIVTSECKWHKNGAVDSSYALSMAGQRVEFKLRIEPAADGLWTSMKLDTPLGTAAIGREGEIVTIEFRDEVTQVTLKPQTILWENFTPVLMSHAIRSYDRQEGGKQTFPLLLIGQVLMEGSLEFKDTVRRTIGGEDRNFHRFVYGVPGVDVTVWADDAGKVYYADVPAQHAWYVRDGFESLHRHESADPLLSKPEFSFEQRPGVWIPMRDGVRLSTDLYLPEADQKAPVILIRTPYKKEMIAPQAEFYARRGYAVAVQDCRGRFASEGTWEPFVNEPEDGYDTIEWLAKQDWCNGKVGMIGASYVGWVQWWAARENPPHLVTIVPNVAPPDPFYNIPYEYGVFFTLGAIWWADILESDATGDLSGVALQEIGEKKYSLLLRPLPVIELDEAILGKENPYWRKWIEHPHVDEYWERSAFLDYLEKVRIPVFHQSGWFDGDGIGSKLNYLRMASHGHPHQKLVLGPWGHSAEPHRTVGDRDFGPEAIVDLQTQYLRWFDRWLKEIDNGIEREPLVSLFVMGANKWIHGDRYPLPQTRFEKWYLASDGKANTSRGDGRLTRTEPGSDSPPDRYVYDPGDPTPLPSYPEEHEDDDQPKTVSAEEEKQKAKARHEEVTRRREDILVYASEPLESPVTFAGPISGVLHASTSGKDTDWFMRLMTVDEAGEIFVLAEGKIRARFRNSVRRPELLEPGQVYKYDLDLWQTGITVPKGHRIRVEVASASFPMFSRNLNTGGHNELDTHYVPAEQAVYHDAERPSYVLLPVIPDFAAQEDATD